MARIRTILPGNQDIGVHQTEVDCTYQRVNDVDGRTFVHLATFGSDERQEQKKASQQIQLDERMTGQLLEVLIEVFPGLQP